MFERQIAQIAEMVHDARRADLPRRRQHERHPGHHPARRFRRRHDALQSAQDLQRPARRRRARRRPDLRQPSSSAPYLPSPIVRQRRRRLPPRLRPAEVDRPRAELLRQRRRAGARRTATSARTGRTACGAWPRTRCSTPTTCSAAVKHILPVPQGDRCMHEFVASAATLKNEQGRLGDGHRQAAARLRLPRPDGLLPADRPRGDDDRADRDREQGDAGRLRRGAVPHHRGAGRAAARRPAHHAHQPAGRSPGGAASRC